MSRFIFLSRAALRRLSAPAAFIFHHSTRHPLYPASKPITSLTHHHYGGDVFSPAAASIIKKHYFHSSAAAGVRMSSGANPVSLASIFGCTQFLLFSCSLSESLASGAKHVENIVTILLQIKHLLHKRFSQQWMQVLFLMCGTVMSLILPLVQAIVMAAGEPSPTINFRLIIAGGMLTALIVKLFWARLFRPFITTTTI